MRPTLDNKLSWLPHITDTCTKTRPYLTRLNLLYLLYGSIFPGHTLRGFRSSKTWPSDIWPVKMGTLEVIRSTKISEYQPCSKNLRQSPLARIGRSDLTDNFSTYSPNLKSETTHADCLKDKFSLVLGNQTKTTASKFK